MSSRAWACMQMRLNQDIQTLGKDVAEGIPGLGTIVSGVAVVWDLGSGAQSIYNCYQGVTE